jgi:hypothetical protein
MEHHRKNGKGGVIITELTPTGARGWMRRRLEAISFYFTN